MLTIIIRSVIIYLIVTVAVRIMGKRQVSDMQTSELVITLIISEVASLPLENPERPLVATAVPIMMIVAIEILVSLLMLKSRRARSLICGHPIVIIKDGKVIDSELRRLRISYEDVYSLLRQQQVSDPDEVRYGIIEPNGTLSVLRSDDLAHNGVQSRDLMDELREQPPSAENAEAPGQPHQAPQAQKPTPNNTKLPPRKRQNKNKRKRKKR